jgi:hypothetical protein
MVFDRRSEVRVDYERELLDLINKILPPFNFTAMMESGDDEGETEKAWLY